MARERKTLAAGVVAYNFQVTDNLDEKIKIKLIKERKKRGGKLDQKDFLAELVEIGLKSI